MGGVLDSIGDAIGGIGDTLISVADPIVDPIMDVAEQLPTEAITSGIFSMGLGGLYPQLLNIGSGLSPPIWGLSDGAASGLGASAAGVSSAPTWGAVDYSLGASQLMPSATSTAVPWLGTGTSAMGLNALGNGATSLASTIPWLSSATTPSLASVGLTGYTPTISDAVVNAATTPATSGGLLDMVNSITNRDLLRTGLSLLGNNQPPQMMGGQYAPGGGGGGGGGSGAGGIPAVGLLSVQRNPYVDIFGASGRRN